MADDVRDREDNFGCDAFGHLASPFVDGELVEVEMARVAAHVDGCQPCQRLTAEYRALERLASPPVPDVPEEAWDAAWTNVRTAIEEDRVSATESPLGGVLRAVERFNPAWRHPVVRPLVYGAAAAVLVVVALAVQRIERGPDGAFGSGIQVAGRLKPSSAVSVTCESPDFMPVVLSTGGNDPLTVVQCVYVGSEG